MPKYHLNLTDGIEVPDIEGQLYESLDSAKIAATKGALELMSADVLLGKLPLSYQIEITDEEGAVMAVLRFRDLLTIE